MLLSYLYSDSKLEIIVINSHEIIAIKNNHSKRLLFEKLNHFLLLIKNLYQNY